VRECSEELGVPAVPSQLTGPHPFFVTVTETRGDRPGRHTDVSLWYLLLAPAAEITEPDRRELADIRWLTPRQVLDQPLNTLDPHMHRFTAKLTAARAARATEGRTDPAMF
jgi:8-oxo-dGTP pyrophosphatase MutT (NUDIX family)